MSSFLVGKKAYLSVAALLLLCVAALAEPAAKPRTTQIQIVAQDVQERRRWIDIQSVRFAVHL